MEISIVQIGNSKGIRLAKAILEQYNIQDRVELVLEEGYLIIKPIHAPRQGWEEAFRKMHEAGDDALLIGDIFEDENWDD
ncbi:MAG: AbrB/MazE/SpoVT family DNA-binding domain-containing protein [Saprospiraceae bacterium]|nr:AbrB/MazE/SpoVT family DNA-binding domain-containing protein [Saprospiraceae bacterium]MDX1939601.1 AbrB/MazE/SpoVT family DNA-binding domain-containing protein [Saprospiraceae bacterium]